ncbi:hypothetical protein AXF42_Ash005395 [Apostasia shenzhenica]|uniref:Uncharacterized protein n=1 Tax=Apostasia shenzhenica TaxID=1088818 RepID=A0A2I0B6U6_9ASPA|nr:hypothetical protein AXF42_Ash005395 [Apostasia shenzhenica]
MGTTTSSAGSTAAVKVIDGDGKVEEFFYKITAAELMQENPGQFVCDSSNLHVGNRVTGLAADQELQRRRLYFLLPVDLLFSVLTDEEMSWLRRQAAAALAAATKKRSASRRRRTTGSAMRKKVAGGGGRKMMFPGMGEFCLRPAMAGEDDEEEGRRCRREGESGRTSRRRSWEPALDTIEEAGSDEVV